MKGEILLEYAKKLKPCPFCGGRARVEIQRCFIRGKSAKAAIAYCSRCNARTSKVERTSEGSMVAMDKAVKLWNRRRT